MYENMFNLRECTDNLLLHLVAFFRITTDN